MSEPILETDDVRKEFGSLVAIDGVSLEFYRDEIVGIIGPNGAGKTTYVNLISGALTPTSGRVLFKDRDISGLKRHKRVQLGLVRSFQIPQIYDELTVFENVQSSVISRRQDNNKLFTPIDRHTETVEETEELLDIFGLSAHADDETEHLPHGIRKVLDVAMSFALDPQYLLLDEPTSGVATQEKEYVIETIVEASEAEGVTTVTIEHDMDLVKEYADRLVVLHEGSVFREGEPELLETDSELRRVLLGVDE